MSGARSGCPRVCKMQYKRKSGTKEFSLNVVNDKLSNNAKIIDVLCVLELESRRLKEKGLMRLMKTW